MVLKIGDIELEAVESTLNRLFAAASENLRKEWAVEILTAVKKAQQLIDQATQIPPAKGEREICHCPVCARQHWKFSPSKTATSSVAARPAVRPVCDKLPNWQNPPGAG